MTLAGQPVAGYKLPGDKQEGMTIANENEFFIADDSGPVYHVVYP